jgi:hypothetical protein
VLAVFQGWRIPSYEILSFSKYLGYFSNENIQKVAGIFTFFAWKLKILLKIYKYILESILFKKESKSIKQSQVRVSKYFEVLFFLVEKSE